MGHTWAWEEGKESGVEEKEVALILEQIKSTSKLVVPICEK